MLKHTAKKLHKALISPRSAHPDQQRREYLFNVLIGFFAAAAAVASLSSGINHLMGTNAHQTNSVPVTLGFLGVSLALWWLSRRGYYRVGATALIALVWLAGLQLAITWSIELPMAQLLGVLGIILAGITISSRAALVVTGATSISTLMIGYLQVSGKLSVDTTWLTKPLELSDAVGLVVIYVIIGAITWLSNREIDALLRRAWRSEKALAKERDQLEVIVARRTKQLERIQLERVVQLQHLAEYGQISASLIHDLATPVTAASLSLEQAKGQTTDSMVGQVAISIKHIQDYIASARNQITGTTKKQVFNPGDEIAEIMGLLKHQARMAGVALSLQTQATARIYGDAATFGRIIANMIINALQAFGANTKAHKRPEIIVTINVVATELVVTIKDFGTGIKPADINHIFNDYYSTKKHIGRGLGLGLAGAKRVIEQEFGGHITVSSTPKAGTIFTIGIPIHETTSSKQYRRRPQVSAGKSGRKRQA